MCVRVCACAHACSHACCMHWSVQAPVPAAQAACECEGTHAYTHTFSTHNARSHLAAEADGIEVPGSGQQVPPGTIQGGHDLGLRGEGGGVAQSTLTPPKHCQHFDQGTATQPRTRSSVLLASRSLNTRSFFSSVFSRSLGG